MGRPTSAWAASRDRFWRAVEDQGARPAPEAVYVDAATRVDLKCAQGHSCDPVPSRVNGGGSVCRRCSGRCGETVARDFHERLLQLGSTLAPGQQYRRLSAPVVLVCGRGHQYPVRPSVVRDGSGQCPQCPLEEAAAKFWAAVRAAGAVPAPGAVYSNAKTRVPLVCGQGHECAPMPVLLHNGVGVCAMCTPGTPARAARRFRDALAARGYQSVAGSSYAGWDTPVDVLCERGHPMAVRPVVLLGGGGVCTTCEPTRVFGLADPGLEGRFWARVADLGATTTANSRYVTSGTPVELLCAGGHTVAPRPSNLLAGQGPCAECVGNDQAAAAANFVANLTGRGWRLQPGAAYTGANRPVPVICPQGHTTALYPTSVQQGGGGCAKCTKNYDRVYLMSHPAAGAVKVGVASGWRRLAQNRGRGYQLVEQWTGLGHDEAVRVEGAVHRWWRAEGWDRVEASPPDGRTETAPEAVLDATRVRLRELLGEPTSASIREGRGDSEITAA